MTELYACEYCGDEKPKGEMEQYTLKGIHPRCLECEMQRIADGFGEIDEPKPGESFGYWNNRVFGKD